MNQPEVFLSHDSSNTQLIDRISAVFGRTSFRMYEARFEDLSGGMKSAEIPAEDILKRQIQKSNALVLHLGGDPKSYTRSWIAWEIGVARASDTAIIVVEDIQTPYEMVVPSLDDYIRFDSNDGKAGDRELRQAIEQAIEYHDGLKQGKDRQTKQCKDTTQGDPPCYQEFGIWVKAREANSVYPCPSCRRMDVSYPY
jgi:hypothetical protein